MQAQNDRFVHSPESRLAPRAAIGGTKAAHSLHAAARAGAYRRNVIVHPAAHCPDRVCGDGRQGAKAQGDGHKSHLHQEVGGPPAPLGRSVLLLLAPHPSLDMPMGNHHNGCQHGTGRVSAPATLARLTASLSEAQFETACWKLVHFLIFQRRQSC